MQKLSQDEIYQILSFVNYFDSPPEETEIEEKEEEEEIQEEDLEVLSGGDNPLYMMLINKQWYDIVNSDKYWKRVIAQFLGQSQLPYYFKVPGYGNKTVDMYRVLIDQGIYKSWKEIFANL